MTDKLIDTVAQHPKLCPHFEVPVQAGNDEVLENMKREYTVEDFRQLVGRIRKRIPDATINTDIIVGFPGESEAQYQDTYDLLKELELDKIHLAKYSERPKTIAERKMTDDVTSVEKERRRKTIDELNEVILTRTNEQWMGQTVEVLVEEKRKERWKGRTPHNRLVFFDSDENLLGALVKVKIEWTGPYTLIGQLEEVLVGPSKVPTPIEIVSSC
jgi:tRNA-2-methylthio-N6-dimethylallyladenosine synthase